MPLQTVSYPDSFPSSSRNFVHFHCLEYIAWTSKAAKTRVSNFHKSIDYMRQLLKSKIRNNSLYGNSSAIQFEHFAN